MEHHETKYCQKLELGQLCYVQLCSGDIIRNRHGLSSAAHHESLKITHDLVSDVLDLTMCFLFEITQAGNMSEAVVQYAMQAQTISCKQHQKYRHSIKISLSTNLCLYRATTSYIKQVCIPCSSPSQLQMLSSTGLGLLGSSQWPSPTEQDRLHRARSASQT